MYKTGVKLLSFLSWSNKQLTTIKGKTWSRGTNSRLPFGVNMNLNLSNAYANFWGANCIVGNMRVANSVKKATRGQGYSKLIFLKKMFLSYTIYFGDNDFLKVLGNTSCFSWKCHLQKVYKLKTLKSCMDISFWYSFFMKT